MNQAVDKIAGAVERGDFAAMQAATEEMRAALAQLDSGIAAHRAIVEGQAPRNIALRWFKREMSLADPIGTPLPHAVLGLSSLHWASMLLLAAFAFTLAWMYVARTRRVNALLASLRVSASESVDGFTSTAVAKTSTVPSPAVITRESPRAPPQVTGGWAGNLRVARIFQETADVKTFRLAAINGSELPFMFEPGQFLTLSATVGGKVVRRSYSIASSPCCHGWCDITVKHAPSGALSGYLHEKIKTGDHLGASGPYGRFTFRGREAPSVVFVAGGVGITPLMSSVRYLTDQSWEGRIDLIYGCARQDAVIFREELEHLARRHLNLHVTVVLSAEPSQEWTGPRGYVTAELLAQIPDIRSRRIHLCGPPVMMEAVKAELGTLGVTGDSIRTELFLSPGIPAGHLPDAASRTSTATCSFARSGKTAPLSPAQSILECAESVGVPIEYACRQGYCGVCKVKLLAGEVTMQVEDGLTAADKASALILACQAKSANNVTVDA